MIKTQNDTEDKKKTESPVIKEGTKNEKNDANEIKDSVIHEVYFLDCIPFNEMEQKEIYEPLHQSTLTEEEADKNDKKGLEELKRFNSYKKFLKLNKMDESNEIIIFFKDPKIKITNPIERIHKFPIKKNGKVDYHAFLCHFSFSASKVASWNEPIEFNISLKDKIKILTKKITEKVSFIFNLDLRTDFKNSKDFQLFFSCISQYQIYKKYFGKRIRSNLIESSLNEIKSSEFIEFGFYFEIFKEMNNFKIKFKMLDFFDRSKIFVDQSIRCEEVDIIFVKKLASNKEFKKESKSFAFLICFGAFYCEEF